MASPVALPNVRTADVVADPTFFVAEPTVFVALPTLFVTLPTFLVTFPTFLVNDFVVLLAICLDDPAKPDAIFIIELVPPFKTKTVFWNLFILSYFGLIYWYNKSSTSKGIFDEYLIILALFSTD
jgi:hypothetical protein